MVKKIITTTKCPVCNYEYQETKYFRKEFKKNMPANPVEIEKQNDELLETERYVYHITKKTKGEERFIEKGLNIIDIFGNVKYKKISISCPKCGVLLDEKICTKEKEIEE